MMYDFLIVGAGLYGSVFAEQAKKAGKKVLVIEQRNHIGGNCYTEEMHGINVHMYGPHIFHTNNKVIWDYINQFAEFNHFVNRVKANYKDKIYSLPINLMTLHQVWGINSPAEALSVLKEVREPIQNPKNMEEWCLANLGRDLYEMFFKGYTTKHWRVSPTELPASIIKRLPVRFTFDDNYYNDRYQGIPIGGYTQIFERMLDGVEVKLNTEFDGKWQNIAKKLIYTGSPDVLLDYKYGELKYLTLDFKHQLLRGDFQGNAQVNYTDKNVPFTRCIEHKHFEFKESEDTIVTREYPAEWTRESTPYYPIPSCNEVYEKYRKDLRDNHPDIILGGRLGAYKYYDMHQIIGRAIKEAKRNL